MWNFRLRRKTGSHFGPDCRRGAPARAAGSFQLQFLTKLELRKAGRTKGGNSNGHRCVCGSKSLIIVNRQEWVPGRIVLKALTAFPGIGGKDGLSRAPKPTAAGPGGPRSTCLHLLLYTREGKRRQKVICLRQPFSIILYHLESFLLKTAVCRSHVLPAEPGTGISACWKHEL